MSILNIPAAVSNAISSLTQHGHKKGIHGGGVSNPLNSSSSSASASTDGQPTGSTQNLFGTLLDSVEQIAGIQTPNAVNSPTAALHASTMTPASITAAQAALKKI